MACLTNLKVADKAQSFVSGLIIVDSTTKKEQALAESMELNNDLLGLLIGRFGVTVLVLSMACFSDPTGNRIIGIIGLVGVVVIVCCDIIKLLSIDFCRCLTK